MGYDTLIGEMGATLSGGQQQRLLLARALYARPSVLILDEATSHLDIDTERRIAAMLEKLEITRVFAAHRPETLAIADRVFRLEARAPSGRRSLRRSAPLVADKETEAFGPREDPTRQTGESYAQR